MHFLQGLTMGLAYVAPIGLQNLFVINTALTQSRRRAAATAFVVIFFDISLALACFFGIGALMEQFPWVQKLVLLAGSVIVIVIGAGLLRDRGTLDTSADVNLPLRQVVATAFVVTWLNPQAIIDGTMMLGAFRVTLPAEQSLAFMAGVASASCLWFLGLTVFITLFSHKFNDRVLRAINVVCGAVIIFYGLKLLLSFIKMVA
ncbi:L-lysine permease [Lacrimispora indolis]|uniref:LysE/ArgO family amino acid transporter n=1 Tax=Eubacterium callanderi TaxID=53442 RepID=UPI001A984EBD|nr:LysE family transporter [Eubacterium callanderi]GFZ22497.1 L-lysine permease [[Clostridium] methoxybenzovorans]